MFRDALVANTQMGPSYYTDPNGDICDPGMISTTGYCPASPGLYTDPLGNICGATIVQANGYCPGLYTDPAGATCDPSVVVNGVCSSGTFTDPTGISCDASLVVGGLCTAAGAAGTTVTTTATPDLTITPVQPTGVPIPVTAAATPSFFDSLTPLEWVGLGLLGVGLVAGGVAIAKHHKK